VSYVAPEQVEGKPVDPRTDIYALGCVLFECLAGSPPFRKEEDLAVIMAHLKDEAPRVTDLRSDCPPELADVVAKALSKPPDQRHQSCEELILDLRAASSRAGLAPVGDTKTPGESPTLPPPAPGRASRRVQWVAAAGLAIAAAIVAVVLVAGGGDVAQHRPSPIPAVAPAPTDSGRWRALRTAPLARQQVASAVAAGRIWVLGGLTGKAATAQVQSYDPAIDTWTAGPDLPFPLHHAMAATNAGEVVAVGGWIPRGPALTAVTSNRAFVLKDGRWAPLPGLEHPRAAGAAAVAAGRVVVVGGQDAGRLVPSTEVFHDGRWKEGAAIPTPREHLAATSDGRYIYAVGGRVLSSDKNSAALERYDPIEDRWTKLPSMPIPSGSLGAAVVGGRLIVVGGEDPTKVLDAVQAFDLRTRRWSTLAPMRTPRHGMAVVAVGDTLYALDGARAPAHAESTSTAEALDFR
jgi:non-specific serine/threonine protein kinase